MKNIEYLKESVLIYKNTIPKISDAIDTVLSLIKENQKQLEKKDKQIDLMAEYWNTGLAMCDNCDRIVEKYEENNCQNCIKRYFAGLAERKVEDE